MACCGELGAKYPFEQRSPQISVNLSRQTALVVVVVVVVVMVVQADRRRPPETVNPPQSHSLRPHTLSLIARTHTRTLTNSVPLPLPPFCFRI
jgi:hypothetical protein